MPDPKRNGIHALLVPSLPIARCTNGGSSGARDPPVPASQSLMGLNAGRNRPGIASQVPRCPFHRGTHPEDVQQRTFDFQPSYLDQFLISVAFLGRPSHGPEIPLLYPLHVSGTRGLARCSVIDDPTCLSQMRAVSSESFRSHGGYIHLKFLEN